MAEHPEKGNILMACNECSKKMYKNKGHFKVAELRKAKFVKKVFDVEDEVKQCLGITGEHMWVEITKIDSKKKMVIGTLANIPMYAVIRNPKEVEVKFSEIEEIK